MKTLRSILVCILLAALTVASIYTAILLHHSDRSAVESNETIAMLNVALKGKHANGDDGLLVLSKVLLQNADGAANALKQTLQAADKIAKAQDRKSVDLADSSIALVKSGGLVVLKLGSSIDTLNAVIGDVRAGTLPKLNAGMDALTADENKLGTTIDGLSTDSHALIVAATSTTTSAGDVFRNPDITRTFQSLSLMADKGTETMTHLDGATANVETVTGYVRDMFKPKKFSLWESVVSMVVRSAAGPAAGAIVTHFLPAKVEVVK